MPHHPRGRRFWISKDLFCWVPTSRKSLIFLPYVSVMYYETWDVEMPGKWITRSPNTAISDQSSCLIFLHWHKCELNFFLNVWLFFHITALQVVVPWSAVCLFCLSGMVIWEWWWPMSSSACGRTWVSLSLSHLTTKAKAKPHFCQILNFF